MKIFITGATGFIGHHLRDRLKNQFSLADIFLHVRDQKSAGSLVASGWRVLCMENMSEVFEKLPDGIDCVVHLAGERDARSQRHILEEANIELTAAVVKGMQKKHIPYCIFSSTANVYGNAEGVTAETTPLHPMDDYARTKLEAENILKEAVLQRKISSATILRFGNIYGPGNAKGMIFNIISNLDSGNPVTYDGAGSQVREPLYVDDAVSAICAAMDHNKNDFTVYNISGKEAFSFNDLAGHIAHVLKKNLILTKSDLPPKPPHAVRLDCSLAKARLDWVPGVSLDHGVQETYAWYTMYGRSSPN